MLVPNDLLSRNLEDVDCEYAEIMQRFKPGDLLRCIDDIEPPILEPWTPEMETVEERWDRSLLYTRILKIAPGSRVLLPSDGWCLVIKKCPTRWGLVVIWEDRLWTLCVFSLRICEKYV